MGHGAWDYLTLPEQQRERLAELGRDGWELVGVGGDADYRLLYLKRPALSFRERVTLDQRHRYFDSFGLDPSPHADGNAE